MLLSCQIMTWLISELKTPLHVAKVPQKNPGEQSVKILQGKFVQKLSLFL